jgi:nitrogen fixation protein FixH
VAVEGEEVPMTVTANRTDLFLNAHVTGLDGSVHDHHIPLHPLGDGTYSATIRPPCGVWQVDVATVNDANPAHVGDLLIVAG